MVSQSVWQNEAKNAKEWHEMEERFLKSFENFLKPDSADSFCHRAGRQWPMSSVSRKLALTRTKVCLDL